MIVIGLMSGTSVDGIDAVLVDIRGRELDLEVELLNQATFPYPQDLREQILAVSHGTPLSMEAIAALDEAIAIAFAEAAINIQTPSIKAELIGSHGQTVFHRPPVKDKLGYSWQLGRGEAIASVVGIPCVSNFRAEDIAAKGQGAPLVPKVDACLLSHPTLTRCVQNLGGIGNVTYLPSRNMPNWMELVCGWDTGPGNVLLDLAVEQLTLGALKYDYNGNWALKGNPCLSLVEKWLGLDFFQLPPPKSTGRELFGLAYLEQCRQDAWEFQLNDADWLATLAELTVSSIVLSYSKFLPVLPDQVLLCGGGSRNIYIKQRLEYALAPIEVLNCDEVGVNADFKEAIAFAILAYWRFHGVTGNLPQVTGAKLPVLLGHIHNSINYV